MSQHAVMILGYSTGAVLCVLGSHIGTSYVGRRTMPGGSPWFAGQQLVACFVMALVAAGGAGWAASRGEYDDAIGLVAAGAGMVALFRHYRHRLEVMREQNRLADRPPGFPHR